VQVEHQNSKKLIYLSLKILDEYVVSFSLMWLPFIWWVDPH